MKPLAFFLLASALLGGCAVNGQQQAEQAEVQLPGERAAPRSPLNVPPDEWAAPPRPAAMPREM
ncbi:MAG TPA: hypothetical protein VMI56_22200 [Reyranella sp.]|nr:hypothetical protein [Reyranella sp.]